MHIAGFEHQQVGGAGEGCQVVFVCVGGFDVDQGIEAAGREADAQLRTGVLVFQWRMGIQQGL